MGQLCFMTRSPTSGSTTIAAAGTAVVTQATKGAASICVVISNTGSNPITAVAVEKAPDALYGTDTALGTAIGTIAAGATKLIELDHVAFNLLKISISSTLGTNFALEMRGQS